VKAHRLFVLALLAVSTVFCAAQQVPSSMYQEMRWRMVGPFRGGRTRAVAGVPSQPNVFYIGACNGGVWKSDDYGRTWMPIFDDQPTQSIGAIAVAPSDPNIVYVSSGEGLQRPDLSVGDGIYKSTDAGKTWTHLPGLRDGQQIPALAVDPRDPNRLFAAVLGHPYGPNPERGIFRSTDGGQSWQKVLYKDENTGGSDIEMDPSHPDILYAGLWQARQGPWEDANGYGGPGGGLFKSTDGGSTWRQLTQGLPQDLAQVNVAIAPSQPSRLYAAFSTARPNSYGSGKNLGFYRSDDAGETWHSATSDGRPAMKIGGGDLPIPRVDPKNPDVVYSTSIVTVRSDDGGQSWMSLRGAPGGDDYQNIWINPNNPDIILLVSDQGAIVSVNRGRTWESWYNQPTAQLYHVQASNTFPYRICSGQQESGSVCISSRGNDGEIGYREWHPVGVIEYGYAAPDPLDPDVIYGAGRTNVSRFHWSTGQVQDVTPIPLRGQYRAERTQPILFSPVDPHVLYYAANVLFKTTDRGQTWQAISPDLARPAGNIPASLGDLAAKDARAPKQRGAIYSLAPSFHDLNTIWAGTDDGFLWVTRDGGKNWQNITPPELIPWSKVTQIAASHFDEQTAYASVSRFRIDDLRPYLYRTHDGGKSWQLITTGLPADAPADTIREDSVRKGLLFAGTEKAVWVSFDDGDHWQPLQLNLPRTSMRDLWIHDDDLIVATHGRGFWILDDITPLRQAGAQVSAADSYLFQPAVAYRVRRSTYTDTPVPPDEPLAQNPPDGAVLDYYLTDAARPPVTLEILDNHGNLVRRFSSDDKPEFTPDEIAKQLIPLYWIRMPKTLSTRAGMHRWVWDLHYPAPASSEKGFPISAVPYDTPREPLGPDALPGQYTVRLTANGRISTAQLTVKLDPRVSMPPAALEQQFKLESDLASMMTLSHQALGEARSLREQIKALSGNTSGPLTQSLTALDNKLGALIEAPRGAATDAVPAPTLGQVNGQAGSLYGGIGQADATPTAAQVQAVAGLAADFSSVMKQWEAVTTADLPAVNGKLKSAGLPELRQDAKPSPEEE
jgi:photosystem II stability/assembly factor-like uncharacterized protein